MLHVLLESGPRRRERGGGWTLASVLMHATLIGSAVALTARGVAVRPREPGPPDVYYVAPSPPQRHLEEQRQRGNPYAPAVPADGPRIPIPPVPWIDPAPGIPTGPLTRIEEFGPSGTTPTTSEVPSGGVYSDRSVDKIVAARHDNPRPEYPRPLRSASLEGEVLVTFVVDTSGRVEPSSISVVRQTHPLFGESVRRWLMRTRYIPAEVNGSRVRQFVQQQIGFTLER